MHHQRGDESPGCHGPGGTESQRLPEKPCARDGWRPRFRADEYVRSNGVQGQCGKRALFRARRSWRRHGAAAALFDGGGNSPPRSLAQGANRRHRGTYTQGRRRDRKSVVWERVGVSGVGGGVDKKGSVEEVYEYMGERI